MLILNYKVDYIYEVEIKETPLLESDFEEAIRTIPKTMRAQDLVKYE